MAKHHGVVTFVLEPKAEDYRKTQVIEQSERKTVGGRVG